MSDLLNDSATAIKVRSQILDELEPGEGILYVGEGHVVEPWGSNFLLFVGALIVTTKRFLCVESKAFGRVSVHSVRWNEVVKTGRLDGGEVAIQKLGIRSLWKVSIWEGKSFKTPLSRKQLDMLSFSIAEAQSMVEAEHGAEVASDYEELRRRRES